MKAHPTVKIKATPYALTTPGLYRSWFVSTEEYPTAEAAISAATNFRKVLTEGYPWTKAAGTVAAEAEALRLAEAAAAEAESAEAEAAEPN